MVRNDCGWNSLSRHKTININTYYSLCTLQSSIAASKSADFSPMKTPSHAACCCCSSHTNLKAPSYIVIIIRLVKGPQPILSLGPPMVRLGVSFTKVFFAWAASKRRIHSTAHARCPPIRQLRPIMLTSTLTGFC
jgi:hypothetical protein